MPELSDRSPTDLRPDVDGAIAELYDATAGRVYGVALALLGDRPSAEDVTREVYLAVSRDATASPGCSSVSSLVTLAHRLAVDVLRHRRHDAAGVPGLDEGSRVPRTASTLLSGLSEQERTALTHAWFGGRTHGDVDVILQAPAGSSARHLREGLRRLRGPGARASEE